jgi:transcriptional regulator with XRE-family HTH domain
VLDDLAGQRFVIVPEGEYRRLREAAEGSTPELPPADACGYYAAVETMRVLLARDILRQRRALGLSQAELARRAGIRPDTLNRLEQGKHSPSVPTVDKIDRALRVAEAERAGAVKTSPPNPARDTAAAMVREGTLGDGRLAGHESRGGTGRASGTRRRAERTGSY